MFEKLLKRSSFSNNVLILVSGTVLAQTVSVLIAPVLTRLFDPADFGLYGLYFGIITIIGSAITGRYHVAIMLPKKDEEAINIVAGAVLVSFVISLLLFIPIFFFNSQVAGWFNNPRIGNWLYLIPVSVFLIGLYESLNQWLLRKKEFKKSSFNKISQKATESASAVSMGLGGFAPGLIISDVLGRFFMNIMCFFQAKLRWTHINKKEVTKQLIKYREYPVSNSLPTLLNASSSNIPIIIISNFFTEVVTGFYNLSRQVLSIPLSMISASLAQVFYNEAVSRINDEKSIYSLFRKLTLQLLLIAGCIVTVMVVAGQFLFSFIFGEDWSDAGFYAAILSIGFAARFVVSPLSILLPALGKIKVTSYWQYFYFLLICGLFFSGSLTVPEFLVVHSLIDVVAYSIYFYIIHFYLKKHEAKLTVDVTPG